MMVKRALPMFMQAREALGVRNGLSGALTD